MTKTVKVDDIKQVANRRLIESKGHEVEYRKGIMAMIETVLHMSGNYKGFYYLQSKDIKEGNPGINLEGGRHWNDEAGRFIYTTADDKFKNTDPTRVNYY